MTEPVTFTIDDWQALTGHDKAAVRILRRALDDFEPLAALPGLGQGRAASAIQMGLAEEGPCSRPGIADKGYRLTKKGWLASEWLNGNRMAVYPEDQNNG